MRAAVLLLALAAVLAGARAGHAFPLRVVAATELRLEPRVSPDRSVVRVAVRLRDDRGAPVRRAAVRLQLRVPGTARALDREVETDAGGDAAESLRLAAGDGVLVARGTFLGTRAAAPASHEIRVSLDAPFVTADVTLPGVVDATGDAVTAVVAVRVGEVVQRSPAGMAVELLVGDRVVAGAPTDASGRVEFRVPARDFGDPGVRVVRARVSVGPDVVPGGERRVIVRAPTALTLARQGDEGAGPDGALLVGALATPRGPVAGAAVRVVRGERTLAGARTDARGAFEVRLGPALLAEPDVVVRAVFDPTEPWYVGARSREVRLTAPPPPRIPWALEVVPVLVAGAVLALALARGRAKTAGAAAAPVAAPEGDVVERVAEAAGAGLRVRLRVTDRATGAPVPRAFARWNPKDEWREAGDEALALPSARRVELEVGASGFAPRTVRAEFPRPGEYVVRVALRTWREELFDRVRPWLRRAARGGALPTPREALGTAAARADVGPLVALVEAGAYGPEAPGAREVEAADALVAGARAAPRDGSVDGGN